MGMHVCYVVSSPMTIRAFLVDHINALSRNYQMMVVANIDPLADLQPLLPGVAIRSLPLLREINLWSDMKALWMLYRLFRREHFVLVHSVTPKAGLLAMTAARLAGVPNRLHTFTGQVWATHRGASRLLLKIMDRILASMTTCALVDSPSQCDFLEREGVLPNGKGAVLGSGSISGVDTNKFRADVVVRKEVRDQLDIPYDAVLFLFLGRLNRDKGVLDLGAAFRDFRLAGHDGTLLYVGPDEEKLRPQIEALAEAPQSRLHFVDYTATPQRYMAAADVFVLPSHREGFGSVVIEAASCGIPAIGTRIYGVTDAIVEGETGLLYEPRNVGQLAACMIRMAEAPNERRELGINAMQRAHVSFAKEILSDSLVKFYQQLLT